MGSLKNLINLLRDSKKVYIQTHNSPDPDAIASAFALQYIFQLYNLDAKICYKGEVEKFNTLKMIELLGIEVVHINEILDMDENDSIVLVDAQKGNSNITDFIGDEVAVIDHHPIFVEPSYSYTDIRSGIGACASIIAEYYKLNQIEIPSNISTALLYGIKVDTLDLTRGISELDIDMFHMLYKLADINLLNKIQLNTLQFSDLFAYSNAIRNIRIHGNIGFADLGFDCHEALLGTVCDFILALAEVEFAIAYSQKENGIKFSIRNETDKLDAGKVINKALESLGSGGGHKSMAGGLIPAGNLSLINGPVDTFIENRFLEVIENGF